MNRKIVKLYNERLKASNKEREDTWKKFVRIVNENKLKRKYNLK